MGRIFGLILGLVLAMTVSSIGQEAKLAFGGDLYQGNETVNISQNVTNDVFAAGNSVTISGSVGDDVHAVGTSVSVQKTVGGDVYAGGQTVNIIGNVAQDIVAAGNSVTISSSEVGGNLRLIGRTIVIDSAVGGNVLVGAEMATLNGTVAGNVNFGGRDLTFGENAKVLGNIVIKGPNQPEVPTSVASPEQVTYVQASEDDASFGVDSVSNELVWSFWPSFLPGIAVLVVAFLIGIIWLALMPDRSTMAYLVSREKPFKSLFIGILGLSMFFGLMIVLAMTLLGIPLVPVALILLVLAWIMGYLSGAYFLAVRILETFGQRIESLGFQAIALAVGLAIAWGLGLIPIIGWLSQLLIVFFGLGAIGLAMVYRRSGSPYHTLLHDRLKEG